MRCRRSLLLVQLLVFFVVIGVLLYSAPSGNKSIKYVKPSQSSVSRPHLAPQNYIGLHKYHQFRNIGRYFENNVTIFTDIPQYSILESGRIFRHRRPHTLRQTWKWVASLSTRKTLYPPTTDADAILYSLATAQIKQVEVFSPDDMQLNLDDTRTIDFGSTPKWLLHLEGGQKAVFKPRWYSRSHMKANWYLGYELHTSEIAAFHLDKLLGFRRAPFTVGRRLHIQKEILPVASEYLITKIKRKSEHQLCFSDQCYLCEKPNMTCTVGGHLEGSVSYLVPHVGPAVQNPWGVKTYHKHIKYGSNNQHHCKMVQLSTRLLTKERALMDLIDMAAFDFLLYHFDSKLYVVSQGKAKGLTLHIDRGRALTRHDGMDDSNLLPLKQCCKYVLVQGGPKGPLCQSLTIST